MVTREVKAEYERTNRNLSVHGYQEEGAITMPFDMRVQNEIDRFHLVKDVLLHLHQMGNRTAYLIQHMNDKLVAHKNYIHEIGQDMPEILDWKCICRKTSKGFTSSNPLQTSL